ncbi:hypothetical protein [Microbacterium sp. P5_E9]
MGDDSGDGQQSSGFRAIGTLMGIDAGDRSYWSWEWSDGHEPGSAVIPADALAGALSRLDEALPGYSEAEAIADAEMIRAASREWQTIGLRAFVDIEDERRPGAIHRLRSTAMAHRCVTGALAEPDREQQLADDLGATLLPRPLLERLAGFDRDEVLVRVLPAASCIRVPWELLSIGDLVRPEKRLIDIANVEMMAPLLSRDGDPAIAHPSWAAAKASSRRPLYVIDPVTSSGHVLPKAAVAWGSEIRLDGSLRGERVSRSWLSTQLLGEPRPSRLFFVGHVVPGEGTAATTGLLLSPIDDDSFDPAPAAAARTRSLTAQDLLVGTSTAPLDTEPDTVPDAAVVDGRVRRLLGAHLWPMPPRVALIACQSGTDLGHVEPFGLVTAMLELGAELVTATRWPLLTDAVFEVDDAAPMQHTPFEDLAHAVDEFHADSDPVRRLNRWQRERLEQWRTEPVWGNSPLTWAAVTNHHAPDRTERGEQPKQIP